MGSIQIACDPKNIFVDWHPGLVDLFMWVVKFTGEVVITSGRRYRTLYSLDSGVHLTDPLRAVDIRSYIYADPEDLCGIINKKFQYDRLRPDMKCAIYHQVAKSGLGRHIHLQAHDRTTDCGL